MSKSGRKRKPDLFSILREVEAEKEIPKSDKEGRNISLSLRDKVTPISSSSTITSGYLSSEQEQWGSSTRESSVVSDTSTWDISIVPKTLTYQSPLPTGIVCAKKSLPPKYEDEEEQPSPSPKPTAVASRLTRNGKNNADSVKSSSIGSSPPPSSNVSDLSPICVICSKPFRAKGCHYAKVGISIAGLKRRFCEYFNIDIREVDPRVEGFLRREKFPFCPTCFVLVHDLYRRGEQVRSALCPLLKVRNDIRQAVTTGLEKVGATQNEETVPYYDIKQMVIQQHFLLEEEQDENLCDIAKQSLGRTLDEIPIEALENTSGVETETTDSEVMNEDGNDYPIKPVVPPAKIPVEPMHKIPVQPKHAVNTAKRCKKISSQTNPPSPSPGHLMSSSPVPKMPAVKSAAVESDVDNEFPTEALENISGIDAEVVNNEEVNDYPTPPILPAGTSSEPTPKVLPVQSRSEVKPAKRCKKQIQPKPPLSGQLMSTIPPSKKSSAKSAVHESRSEDLDDEISTEALERISRVDSDSEVVNEDVSDRSIPPVPPAKIPSEPMPKILPDQSTSATKNIKAKNSSSKKIRGLGQPKPPSSGQLMSTRPLSKKSSVKSAAESEDLEDEISTQALEKKSGAETNQNVITNFPTPSIPSPKVSRGSMSKLLPAQSTSATKAKKTKSSKIVEGSSQLKSPFFGQLMSSKPLFNTPPVKSLAAESSSEDSDDEAFRRLTLKSKVVINSNGKWVKYILEM